LGASSLVVELASPAVTVAVDYTAGAAVEDSPADYIPEDLFRLPDYHHNRKRNRCI